MTATQHNQKLEIHLDILGNLEPVNIEVFYTIDPMEVLGKHTLLDDDLADIEAQDVVFLDKVLLFGVDILSYLGEDVRNDLKEEVF